MSKPVNKITEAKFNIIVEQRTLATTNSLVDAIEVIFAAALIFDLKYPELLKKSFIFIQHFWLKINDTNITKKMCELNSSQQ